MVNKPIEPLALKRVTGIIKLKLLMMRVDNKIEEAKEAKKNQSLFGRFVGWIRG